MKKSKEKKERPILEQFLIRTIIFIFIVLVLCSTFFFREKVERLVNYAYNYDAPASVIDKDGLIVHFVDVGQADSTIIQFPTGEIMIIDTGDSNEKSSTKFKNYLNTIDFKKDGGEPVIDYLILTHPDSDHIGNAEYVFENFLVKNCYLPQIYPNTPEYSLIPNAVYRKKDKEKDIYESLFSAIENEVSVSGCNKIFASEGLSIKSSSYDEEEQASNNQMWILDFFAPISGSEYTQSKTSNLAVTNDYSPIMILNYLNKKIMFTGDASQTVEKEFVAKVQNNEYSYDVSYFDVDILKIGHHGSAYSSCAEFLNIVKPEFAVASAGKGNKHGHPSDKALERLKESGINPYNIYRTDINENIAMGVSLTGEIALEANHLQYVKVEFKLWQIILIAGGVSAIIIYSPYTVKIAKYKKFKKGKSEK